MKTLIALTAVAVFVISARPINAQDFPGPSTPNPEHEFLQKFVGDWDLEISGPGMQGKAVMNSTMLGKLWLVNSSEHAMSGMKIKSIQMIGFDPEKKKYVGIWADSMMNYMWRYEGTVDETGKKLTLEAEGPSMSGDGTMAQFRDAYEFKDDDTIIATSTVKGKDGEWTEMMKSTGKRRKEK